MMKHSNSELRFEALLIAENYRVTEGGGVCLDSVFDKVNRNGAKSIKFFVFMRVSNVKRGDALELQIISPDGETYVFTKVPAETKPPFYCIQNISPVVLPLDELG